MTRPPAWVADHVAAASRVLAAHNVRLEMEQAVFMPARCQLLTRDDRNAMAEHVVMDGAVTVLVLPRVRDLDVLTYDLMGVHWRYQGTEPRYRGRRWIFLTARAEPPVLAHELCHYFGLPHDLGGGNLMAPGPSTPIAHGRTPPKPFAAILTAAQAAKVRRGISRFLGLEAAAAREQPR